MEPVTPTPHGKEVVYRYPEGITEIYKNRPDGIEQIFVITKEARGEGRLVVEGEISGADFTFDGSQIAVKAADGRNVLVYGKLLVKDATGRQLASHIEVAGRNLKLVVDEDGQYPIEIDPLLTTPSWNQDPADQAGSQFGISVATAGDINGDGYSDVIIGCPKWNGAEFDEGRVYVYYGSASDLGTTPWAAGPTD